MGEQVIRFAGTGLLVENLIGYHITSFQLFDLAGAMIFQKKVILEPNEVFAVDLSLLPNGVFTLVALATDGKKYLHKLVK